MRYSLISLMIFFTQACSDFSSAIVYPGMHNKYALSRCRFGIMAEKNNIVFDGEEIAYYKIYSSQKAKGTIVYFHGNGDTACNSIPAWQSYPDDYDIIFYEYPGYYKNNLLPQAQPSEAKIIANVKAFINQIYPASRHPLILHGQSLGTAVGTYLAAHYPDKIGGLILTSPFTAISDIASSKIAFFGPLMQGNSWLASEWAKEVKAPVLIIHGDRDLLIPYEMGLQEAANFKNTRVDFFIAEGAGHNDVPDGQAIKQFLKRLLP